LIDEIQVSSCLIKCTNDKEQFDKVKISISSKIPWKSIQDGKYHPLRKKTKNI